MYAINRATRSKRESQNKNCLLISDPNPQSFDQKFYTWTTVLAGIWLIIFKDNRLSNVVCKQFPVSIAGSESDKECKGCGFESRWGQDFFVIFACLAFLLVWLSLCKWCHIRCNKYIETDMILNNGGIVVKWVCSNYNLKFRLSFKAQDLILNDIIAAILILFNCIVTFRSNMCVFCILQPNKGR